MLTIDEIKKMPVQKLRELAASLGIDASKTKKSEIVELLLSLGEPDDTHDEPGSDPRDEKRDGPPADTRGNTRMYFRDDQRYETPGKTCSRTGSAEPGGSYGRTRDTKSKQFKNKCADKRYPSASGGSFRNGYTGSNGYAGSNGNSGSNGYAGNSGYAGNAGCAGQENTDAGGRAGCVMPQGQDPDAEGPKRTDAPCDHRAGRGRESNGEGDFPRDVPNENNGAEQGAFEQPDERSFDCYGILELNQNSFGFLRAENLYPSTKDVFVAPPFIKKYALRTGDMICGKARMQSKEYNAQFALVSIDTVNGVPLESLGKRPAFETLVPIYPDSQLILETSRNEYSTRLIDMIAPIGKGQRGLIVSPPKAGKTVLLKQIANSITANYPDIHLIMLLIDERPEEVTDIKESVNAMVVASTFDEMTSRHITVSEFCLEHAERLVEMGQDVVILMDSITRLARAYNQEIPPTGRSLSGGLDPGALYKPKKFFGAARNIKGGGSLTIIATALVDTGSRLDDVIYEEFKGTGNMELHLDRSLAEKRIFPSIDVTLSGTRKEELLLSPRTLEKIYALRRYFSTSISSKEVIEKILSAMAKTENNQKFIDSIKIPEQKY